MSQQENIQSEINLMRKVAKECADSLKVKEYVTKMSRNILNLYKFLYGNVYDALLLDDLTARNYSPRVVNKKNMIEALQQGNIREQMSLILRVYTGHGCDFFTMLTKKYLQKDAFPEFVNTKIIESHLQEMETVFGIDRKDILNMEKCGTAFPCAMFDHPPIRSSLYIAEYPRAPWLGPAREVRTKENQNSKKPDSSAIYPSLSEREVLRLGAYDSNRLPWVTGYQVYKPKENSFSVCLFKYYNEAFIAGPSGATDMIFNVCGLFKDFDPTLTALACIAWMCMLPDHSCAEILLSARPYGVPYVLSKKKSSIQFTRDLLNSVNQGGGSTSKIVDSSRMATRFRRLRTRKLRKTKALKTRKTKGGNLFTKKPLSSMPTNLSKLNGTNNKPYPNELPKEGEEWAVKDWPMLYKGTIHNVSKDGIKVKNGKGKIHSYSWKQWDDIEQMSWKNFTRTSNNNES